MSSFNATGGFNNTMSSNVTTPANNQGSSSTQSPPHGLLLQPSLTPAFGVAGALLMLSSIPYAIASIKHSWIYRSLSCAYLISICITVLILEVMTVPAEGNISHTTQAKYLIAVVLPSIAIGGLVQWYLGWLARRCGCIVGGFCLGMWIETLSPGGVIKKPKMTAVLITVICAVSLAPTISMFKRWVDLAYMVFSSFSGSTALVLGIDCYSRAGLKEFWIFTWQFHRVEFFGYKNDNYPLTKGVIAEIAAIPVLFLLALAVQAKFWKPLRAHQKETAAARVAELREDQEKQTLNAEQAFKRRIDIDRSTWEMLYRDHEPRRKMPDVSQKPATPPTLPSKTGQRLRGAADFIRDKFKPDLRLSITKNASEQHPDQISPVEALGNSAKAPLDISKTSPLVPVKDAEVKDEVQVQEKEARGPPPDVPILGGHMVNENGKILNEDGEEIAYTLRPTSKPPPLFLPRTYYENDTPLDDEDDTNMRSISPSLTQEDSSEWKQDISQMSNFDERVAVEELAAPDMQGDMEKPLQYAHNGSTSELPEINKHVGSLTHFPKLDAVAWQEREQVTSRTHEWSKTLSEAEPISRVSSIVLDETKDEPSLWQGFEGSHPTKGSAERLEEPDLAASQPQRCSLSRASAVKEGKRKARPTSDIESNAAILPTPVKSARVSKHNASLPMLNTASSFPEGATTRKEEKKKCYLSGTSMMAESQGSVARRNFGSYGKLSSGSSDVADSPTTLAEKTRLQVRKRREAREAREASSSQVSPVSSQGRRVSSGVSFPSPIHTTAGTTPNMSSPTFSYPYFAKVAHPLSKPYPMPPGVTPPLVPNSAFGPGQNFTQHRRHNSVITIQHEDAAYTTRLHSAPGYEAQNTLMQRIEADQIMKKHREELLLQASAAAAAAKLRKREIERRRRTIEATHVMMSGNLEVSHRDAMRKMQGQVKHKF